METTRLHEGELRIGDLAIVPGLTEARFRATEVGGAAEPWVANPPHRSYLLRLDGADPDEPAMTVALSFTSGGLRRTNLGLVVEPPNGVDPWSAAWQQGIRERHDRWLERALGGEPPYRYGWGEIRSYLDAKAGFAQIGIVYAADERSA